jgi:hypothetical protein
MYNSRIGRWMIGDPEAQYFSPYEGMGNDPAALTDPFGTLAGGGDGDDDGPIVWETLPEVTISGLYNKLARQKEAIGAYIDRQRQLGFTDDQITDFLETKNLNNESWKHVMWAMSKEETSYREIMTENWKTQGKIAEEIAWWLVPMPGVGRALRFAGRIVGKKIVTWSGERLVKYAVDNPLWTTETQVTRYLEKVTSAREFGTGVDNAFKAAVKNGTTIYGKILRMAEKHGFIWITESGKYGADMIGGRDLGGFWWDVTTEKSWGRHVAKYLAGGTKLTYLKPIL